MAKVQKSNRPLKYLIEEIAEKYPDLVPGQIYKGCEKLLWWRCEAGLGHPNYQQSYIVHSQDHGCRECARLTWGASQRLTTEEIAENFPDLVPGQTYVNSNSFLWWECPVGHPDYKQIYNSHQQGRGCPECAESRKGASQRLSIEQIAKNFPELVEGQTYTNSDTRLWWKCLAGLGHPDYLQIYGSHQAGRGCPKCGKYKSGNGEWGSRPECFVMNYLADLGVPYAHDGAYNGNTRHRWDVMPFRKTLEGRRFLIEVTSTGPVGTNSRGSTTPYWPDLHKKVTRARRAGDIVVVLKFYGKDREDVCDSVLFPALVQHGILD